MKKINYFLFLFLLVIFSGPSWADTGATTTNGFLYKPPLSARGQTEKNTFDAGLNRVDARLGKETWVGDPNYGATFQAAVTAIGSNNVILRVPAGTHNVTADLPVPANITLKPERGAVFAIANNKTLTINGSLSAGLYQIFSCSGTGKVVIGENPQIDHVYPEWWGALGNAWYINGTSWYADSAYTIPAHDDSAAMQAAITCVDNPLYRRAPRIDLNGHYFLGTQVTITGKSERPYFHGTGGGSQYGYDKTTNPNPSDADGPGLVGAAIINGTTGYAIKIADYCRPFFDNILFFGGITDAAGTGSIAIADCAGGQGFRNCTFIKGYSGVCFQPSAIYPDSIPYGIMFDRCRFQNYRNYAPTYNSDWITSPDQDRSAALRFEMAANIDFYSCDFSGWASHFYGDYPTHGHGYFGDLRFTKCWLQGSAMQSFYTAGRGSLKFKDSYFEYVATCLPFASRSYYSTGGTDSRLAVIDLASAKTSYPCVINFDGVDVANTGFAGDNAADQGRTMIVAFNSDLFVTGGRINTGTRPFARIQQRGQCNINGPYIVTTMSGTYPLSSGDALNFYGAGTYDRYSPDVGLLVTWPYGSFEGAYFQQKPQWMARTYDPGNGGAQYHSLITFGPLIARGGFQLGELQNVWEFSYSLTNLGAQSRRGDIIWNTQPANNGTKPLGYICVDNGSDWGGSGNGTWIAFGQVGYQSGSGSPSGSITPNFIGEEYLNTSGNHWYKAHGLTNTDWTALN